MNRGSLTPRPEETSATYAYPSMNQSTLSGVADQTTPGALYCLMCLPRTQLGTQVFPFPPTNPYYPLLLGF